MKWYRKQTATWVIIIVPTLCTFVVIYSLLYRHCVHSLLYTHYCTDIVYIRCYILIVINAQTIGLFVKPYVVAVLNKIPLFVIAVRGRRIVRSKLPPSNTLKWDASCCYDNEHTICRYKMSFKHVDASQR